MIEDLRCLGEAERPECPGSDLVVVVVDAGDEGIDERTLPWGVRMICEDPRGAEGRPIANHRGGVGESEDARLRDGGGRRVGEGGHQGRADLLGGVSFQERQGSACPVTVVGSQSLGQGCPFSGGEGGVPQEVSNDRSCVRLAPRWLSVVGRTITPGDGTVAEQLRDKICASFAERLEVFFTEGARIREVCEGFRGGSDDERSALRSVGSGLDSPHPVAASATAKERVKQ